LLKRTFLPPGIHIGFVSRTHRQIIADKEKEQYLGYPTTVLLEDNKTIIFFYPKGHGRGAIVMKKSTDGGLPWSQRLPVPENCKTSLEVPTIYRVKDEKGKKRLILFPRLYPAQMAVSEDDGKTWTPLKAVGDWGSSARRHFCANNLWLLDRGDEPFVLW